MSEDGWAGSRARHRRSSRPPGGARSADTPSPHAESRDCVHRNEVRLVGRLCAAVREQWLPGGTVVCTFRLMVRRDGGGRAASIDALECVTPPDARVPMAVRGWAAGDVIEVQGAIRRRRIWRQTTGGTIRCCVIEVGMARRLARAAAMACPVPAAGCSSPGG